MSNLEKIKKEILADNIVDAEECKILRNTIFADGIIDRNEADTLFDINNSVSGNANAPEWQTLFVEAVSAHVLKDEKSPGIIDDDEANWLITKIKGDGNIDECEKALLTNIKDNAGTIPQSLTDFCNNVL